MKVFKQKLGDVHNVFSKPTFFVDYPKLFSSYLKGSESLCDNDRERARGREGERARERERERVPWES